jgi:DUF4097 and DUF4098 domain-containing protein YvlB
VACSDPRFVAAKTVELDVPLAQASTLDCKTHNGDINSTGTTGPVRIETHNGNVRGTSLNKKT